MKLLLLLHLVALAACGGANPTPQTDAVAEPVVEEPPAPPTYVIVHRNTPIHLQPGDDAPFLQYRTPERQTAVDGRTMEDDEERAEKLKADDEAWWEKEKARRERLRKRLKKYRGARRAEVAERDRERAEARVSARAERKLRDIRKHADRHRLQGPDRPWIPFRLVKRQGEWLQLSPVHRDADPPHCYMNNFGEVDRLDATFWVRETGLEPVITRSVTIAPAQGTQVILRPGIAVQPIESDDPDRYEVFVDGFVLELTVPAGAVGTEYEPVRGFEAPMTDTVFTPIAWADNKLRLGTRDTLPYNPYRDLYVTGTLFVGSRFFVTTETPCAEYTVRASEDDIEPVGKRGVMRLSGEDETISPPFARPGALSYLPGGGAFATVRQPFPLGDTTQVVGERQCYRSAVWGETDAAVARSLELCFDPADLEMPAD